MTTKKLARRQVSELAGEVAVLTHADAESVDVPFAAGFDLDLLKDVDDDPMFVTVSIKSGRGDQGTGPDYGADVLRSIEAQINTKKPPGYKGHQNPENTAWEHREPVTAWLGASFTPDLTGESEGTLYVKGYILPTSPDLRTQLGLSDAGAAVVDSVSIFGMRELDGDKVTSFDLWSLDWTPKGKAGMETELVSISGEQTKEDDVTRDEIIASLKLDEVPAHLATALREEGTASVSDEVGAVGEMRVLLELGDGDPDAVVAAVQSLVDAGKAEKLSDTIDAAMDEEGITAEMAQAAVRDALGARLNVNSTDKEIAGEFATVKDLPYIKALTDGKAVEVIQGGGANTERERTATHWG